MSKTERPIQRVFCCDCRHCTRDTSGLSFSNDTGEYFMGTCARGTSDCGDLKPHIFLNKPRECNYYSKSFFKS
ncbi:MAG: hypothetical protein IJR13_07695 [Bacteroidales bacterium]|nr:hypothetical protein [Bacteroidales bacterium]